VREDQDLRSGTIIEKWWLNKVWKIKRETEAMQWIIEDHVSIKVQLK
jgi:hypothetical protein